jgi:phosphoglucosamine mutase
MARKYFGTDGIRGLANGEKLTPDLALKVGMAAGLKFVRGDHRNRVVIGKDTRRSGYLIENALAAGFTAVGMDVYFLGPMPTPAVAMLTRSLRADLGVMISASHNPYDDNGIKLFRPDGYKLSDEVEADIEDLIESDMTGRLARGRDIGRAHRDEAAQTRYIEYAKRTLPKNVDLSGLRVVIDCANGAAYKVAPTALWELGAEVFAIGVEPDGFNINDKVGSTAPDALRAKVKEMRADIGIALDGDADRVIIVDEHGEVVDGDQLMAVIAQSWHARGSLRGNGLVATVMSNLGLERYLTSLGLGLERTAVGDRYVLEAMRAGGFNLGGEQSGHIIMRDHATTGDGILTALHVLQRMTTTASSLRDLASVVTRLPQVLVNVPGVDKDRTDDTELADAVAREQEKLGDTGRVLLRPSGTEPLVRVMVEAATSEEAGEVAARLADVVRRRLTL